MTIIHANHYLNQLLAPAELERIARLCKFCLRLRATTPWRLEWAIDFLLKNARETKQRKFILNRILVGILIDVFS
jgi:hypothetical protein